MMDGDEHWDDGVGVGDGRNELSENINEDQNEFLLQDFHEPEEQSNNSAIGCILISSCTHYQERHVKRKSLTSQHVSHQYPHWKDIPADIKRKLWLGMKQKFNRTDDLPVKKAVYEQLNRQYWSYRHKLHAHYLKHKGTQNILEQFPTGVSRGDWELLSNYFESDDFKKVRDRNKKNQQKLTMCHTCGTKSIAQYCYEERDIETGQEPTRTSTWKKLDTAARKKIGLIKLPKKLTLQNEPNEEDVEVMNEDDAFIQVLGDEKSSRLRGCGGGLKPPSKAGGRINAKLQKENEDLRKQVEEGKECIEVLRTENKEMAIRVDSLKDKIPKILQSLK
ncbi:hypothetical protein C2S51_003801 [Perilla frutescens var. frutescens]|nr:hypothetical protein C2S51_003801 [Perilla frutescens var. frutescens]